MINSDVEVCPGTSSEDSSCVVQTEEKSIGKSDLRSAVIERCGIILNALKSKVIAEKHERQKKRKADYDEDYDEPKLRRFTYGKLRMMLLSKENEEKEEEEEKKAKERRSIAKQQEVKAKQEEINELHIRLLNVTTAKVNLAARLEALESSNDISPQELRATMRELDELKTVLLEAAVIQN